ncbi:HAD family hydrolase [Paenibacillus sp. J5C_2022]|uniref:HAD family hydrolase n=1 Tax=Paenibacillus sp. J5C2022 TaxID=2977129 RepID=UPI0021D280D6|nr:HAD family hydrolase [Paenibacillus sp. J5C2022]MCU6709019.1 HAD family hydrolase [Paenibacillus sp. J5C2022]
MYKTIIFDVDGTLIDTEKAVLGSLQRMLKLEYGLSYEQAELAFVLGVPGASVLPRLGAHNVEAAIERWNEHMKDFKHTMRIFEGVPELLGQLYRRDVRTGIVTSKTKSELRDDFIPFGLMEYLSVVVCASDTLLHKPHPEPLQKFLELSGADPRTSIYIGDTIYDYQCARDAGVAFGLALWGAKTREGIHERHVLDSPLDVLTLIDG